MRPWAEALEQLQIEAGAWWRSGPRGCMPLPAVALLLGALVGLCGCGRLHPDETRLLNAASANAEMLADPASGDTTGCIHGEALRDLAGEQARDLAELRASLATRSSWGAFWGGAWAGIVEATGGAPAPAEACQ